LPMMKKMVSFSPSPFPRGDLKMEDLSMLKLQMVLLTPLHFSMLEEECFSIVTGWVRLENLEIPYVQMNWSRLQWVPGMYPRELMSHMALLKVRPLQPRGTDFLKFLQQETRAGVLK